MKTKLFLITYLVLLAVLLIFITIFSSTCISSKKEVEKENIKELEAKFYPTRSFINRDLAIELAQAYNDFAKKYSEDTLTAEYLFRAGEISMNINMARQAIQYFDRISNNFPEYKKVPYCVFLQAFIYDTQLNNLEKAREYYNLFIYKFPDHELVKDAKASINNLGKSLEEIIESFEEKQ